MIKVRKMHDYAKEINSFWEIPVFEGLENVPTHKAYYVRGYTSAIENHIDGLFRALIAKDLNTSTANLAALYYDFWAYASFCGNAQYMSSSYGGEKRSLPSLPPSSLAPLMVRFLNSKLDAVRQADETNGITEPERFQAFRVELLQLIQVFGLAAVMPELIYAVHQSRLGYEPKEVAHNHFSAALLTFEQVETIINI